MVINFLPRDIYHLSAGHLDTGGFCQLSAFVTISAVTALNCGSVCISYATFRLVNGNPMPDKLVIIYSKLIYNDDKRVLTSTELIYFILNGGVVLGSIVV